MRFDILTLFPGILEGFLNESLIKKAREKGSFSINIRDIRQFTSNKHNCADDTSFGGGPGMVMMPQPAADAIRSVKGSDSFVIMMSPSGKPLDQAHVKELSGKKHIVILCGRYEGIDERVMNLVDEEISIGDYVLSGGELPAAVLVEAVSRYIPGVIKEADSVEQDSFTGSLLDHPHFTKPAEHEGIPVPDTLTGGNHEEIRKWRRKESLKRTLFRRPDLLAEAELTDEDKKFLEEIIQGNQ